MFPNGITGSELSWTGTTTIHPLGLAILILCIIAVIRVPRNKVVIPLLILLVAIPSAQRIVILSLDFSFIRILILITLARIFIRKENRENKTVVTDRLIIFWGIWSILAYGLLLESTSGIVSRTGYMVDAIGAYYIGRTYIKNTEDIQRIMVFLGWISIIVAIFFLVERTTGRNIFSMFGGVPEITLIRDGRLRCQGPFLHPIMAGVFWASILPWFTVLWINKTIPKWKLSIFIFSTLFIVLNTASSTPVMAILFGIIGLLFFKVRRHMRAIRLGLMFILIVLHFVMSKPVWHLLARIDVVSGSTGYHRYDLIDKAIVHLSDWWLFGTLSTGHWGNGLQDVTNQFILEGVSSGLLGMVLFILIFTSTFSLLGKKMKMTNSNKEYLLLWSAGVVLFMHIASFFAVSYFGQVVSAFFLFLGVFVSIASRKNTEKLP